MVVRISSWIFLLLYSCSTIIHAQDQGHSHIVPTLLSVRDGKTGDIVHALNNSLYEKIFQDFMFLDSTTPTFRGTEMSPPTPNDNILDSSDIPSLNTHMQNNRDAEFEGKSILFPSIVLSVDKHAVSFHEPLTLSWHLDSLDDDIFDNFDKSPIHDDDIIAMYCPADEPNGENFRDATTIQQTKWSSLTSPESDLSNQWHIHSFPVIREETCEFRLWGHRPDESDPMKDTFSRKTLKLLANTGPIAIRHALARPTGIHIALSEKVDEMRIHFTTGDIRRKSTKDEIKPQKGKMIPVVLYGKIIKKENTNEMDTDHSDQLFSIQQSSSSSQMRFLESNENNLKKDLSMKNTKDPFKIAIGGISLTYQADDMCAYPANSTEPGKFIDPGFTHIITLKDLEPDVSYWYRVGVAKLENIDTDLNNHKLTNDLKWEDWYHLRYICMNMGIDLDPVIWSKRFEFQSAPDFTQISSDDIQNYIYSFLAYGDQGYPTESEEVHGANGGLATTKAILKEISQTISHRNIKNHLRPVGSNDDVKAKIRTIHHIGDISYAKGAGHIWDAFLQMIQPFSSRIPMMVGVGNHEYDHIEGGDNGRDPSGVSTPGGYAPAWGNFNVNDSGGECGVPISKRWVMPQSNGSNGVFWYSYNYATTHIIVLSSEHDLTPLSDQFQWLAQDLMQVDRSITPWVIVETHRPLYNSYDLPAQNEVGIHMRESLEDLFFLHGVDMVLAGHYHSYLRTCTGLYKSQCNYDGTSIVHITVGTAGYVLSESEVYESEWTEAHVKTWGYGKVTVYGSDSLHWQFISDEELIQDEVWLYK